MLAALPVIGLVVFVVLMIPLLSFGNVQVSAAFFIAALAGLVAGIVGVTSWAPMVQFMFYHPIGSGVVYGIIMAIVVGWHREVAPLGMIVVGVPSGFVMFILLCVGSGVVLHH